MYLDSPDPRNKLGVGPFQTILITGFGCGTVTNWMDKFGSNCPFYEHSCTQSVMQNQYKLQSEMEEMPNNNPSKRTSEEVSNGVEGLVSATGEFLTQQISIIL